jgi:hypothetical protein
MMVSLAVVQVWTVHRSARYMPVKPPKGTSLEVKVTRPGNFSLSDDSKENETYEFTEGV